MPVTKEERHALSDQIDELKRQLREDDEQKFINEMVAAEDKFLGRYFRDGNKLVHPISVQTPECPYQIWCLVIDAPQGLKYKPNMHKAYLGPEDKYTYWLYYQPMYIHRYFHTSFKMLEEISAEEFDEAAHAQFDIMWEQIHETIRHDEFKEKVKGHYDPMLTM